MRLAAQAKGGFYPTPEKVVDFIATLIRAPAGYYYRGREVLRIALAKGSRKLLSTYLQSLLAYPDGCTRGETVLDPDSQDVIVQVPPLSEERLYPKERALVDLVAAERLEGRRVLVYATHTGTRDVTERMSAILAGHGFRVAVMKADAVAPDRREAWVENKVKEGIDVLICHPRLVQTGLDLIDFPTIVWAETDYSVYVMRQASRRSWRIGQTRPVKVVFMAYRGTLQADALKLVAKKLQSSLAVEGESVEDAFAQSRDAEAVSEELLVDEGWHAVEVETETVEVHRNGTGAPVEIGAANGHDGDGAGEQQSLFSWAEFMAEEPPKPSRNNGKPKPATMSMFEWALSMEEEKEAQTVS